MRKCRDWRRKILISIKACGYPWKLCYHWKTEGYNLYSLYSRSNISDIMYQRYLLISLISIMSLIFLTSMKSLTSLKSLLYSISLHYLSLKFLVFLLYLPDCDIHDMSKIHWNSWHPIYPKDFLKSTFVMLLLTARWNLFQ